MSLYSIRDAAALLGVSDDTLRRWIESGRLTLVKSTGRQRVDGKELAALAQRLAGEMDLTSASAQSARNRFAGLVTKVAKDGVMAQVDVQAGPFRVVSLMSREAVEELSLEPGMLVVAGVKATSVVIEVPQISEP